MIVLDTNVVSELFRREPNRGVVSWLESLAEDLAITSITLAELLAGVRRLPEGRRKFELESAVIAAVEPYLGGNAVLAFDDACAAAYAAVIVERERAGLPITTADAQIAAICRTHGAVCATRNTKDLVGTGVELINPWGIPR